MFVDYRDDQHSPQSMGGLQHQAPDTTSPSPPHSFSINGSAIGNTNGFPSTMLPQDTSVSLWGQQAATAASLCKKANVCLLYLLLNFQL